MFKALESGSTIPVQLEHLIALSRSSNQQLLAVGGGRRRSTRASILGFRHPMEATYRIYVYLGATEPGPAGEMFGLLFRSDPLDTTDEARFHALYQDALTMVQRQGFAMEVVDLVTLTLELRDAIADDVPFAGSAPPTPVPTPSMDSSGLPLAQLPSASREISLPGSRAVNALGRLLTLF